MPSPAPAAATRTTATATTAQPPTHGTGSQPSYRALVHNLSSRKVLEATAQVARWPTVAALACRHPPVSHDHPDPPGTARQRLWSMSVLSFASLPLSLPPSPPSLSGAGPLCARSRYVVLMALLSPIYREHVRACTRDARKRGHSPLVVVNLVLVVLLTLPSSVASVLGVEAHCSTRIGTGQPQGVRYRERPLPRQACLLPVHVRQLHHDP